MENNKSLLEEISQLNSEFEKTINQFDNSTLFPDSAISFSFSSIYININSYTNFQYSWNPIYQDKTLTYLNKLIKKSNVSLKSVYYSKTISSSSLSDPSSNIKSLSNIIKKDSLSLSFNRTNSSISKYKDFLNIKDNKKSNYIDGNNGIKSAFFDFENKAINNDKVKKMKRKLKYTDSEHLKIKSDNKNKKLKSNKKEKIQTLKSISKKRQKRKPSINQVIKINLKETFNFDNIDIKNNELFKRTDIKKEKIFSDKENKKKIKKKKKKNSIISQNNNIAIKNIEAQFLNKKQEKASPRKSIIDKKRERIKSLQKELNLNNNISIKKPNKSNNALNNNDLNPIENKKLDREEKIYSENYFAKEQKEEDCIII